MTSVVKELVSEQALKIEADCDRASVRDSLASTTWDWVNFWLGITSAGLAGVAAFTAGREQLSLVTSGMALVSAILGSILTFLAPAQKAENYHKFSNRYRAMRDSIRAFIAFKCVEDADDDLLKKEFQGILSEKQKIDSEHPVVPNRYYAKAVKIIEERIKRNVELKRLKNQVGPFHEFESSRPAI